MNQEYVIPGARWRLVVSDEPETSVRILQEPVGIGSRDIERVHHDVRASFETLEQILFALKSGYKFDDKLAPEYVKRLDQAMETLRPEFKVLSSIYGVFRGSLTKI